MQPVPIVLAEDDEDDQMIVRKAFKKARFRSPLQMVSDGQELMRYLRAEGEYSDRQSFPMPGLILLDLNMPVMSGEEALAEIKADKNLKHIPVVILTTTDDQTGVNRCYELGASTFITKPVTFSGFLEVVSELQLYWFSLVDLPDDQNAQ
ncbi:response regulator [Marinobacter sp. CHS3-4]|uniref:response regulator n=1 Tax=Marinobacter sp. CHS3-4 TaxID=3045174 RepID=UPI0024B4F3D0|nr:response regulator [Marinobacter sp. CHS3-4]MDI9245615.1 response regulator [Marinobacter sp. CHS3-4]